MSLISLLTRQNGHNGTQTLKIVSAGKAANSLWVRAWNAYGSSSPSAKSNNLVQYMASQGVNIDDSLGDKAVLFGSGISSFLVDMQNSESDDFSACGRNKRCFPHFAGTL